VKSGKEPGVEVALETLFVFVAAVAGHPEEFSAR
jgi:hypothetical protein